MQKSLPIPVIAPGCIVKVIDDSADRPVWREIGECFDAPNPIRKIMLANKITTAWIFGITGKRLVTMAELNG